MYLTVNMPGRRHCVVTENEEVSWGSDEMW